MSLSSTMATRPSWVYSFRTVTNVSGPVLPRFSLVSATHVVRVAGLPKTSGAWVRTRPPANIRFRSGPGGAGIPKVGCPSGPRSAWGRFSNRWIQCHREGSSSLGMSVPSRFARASAGSGVISSVLTTLCVFWLNAVISGRHRSTFDELPDDDVALDLVGALADDHQRRVTEVALDVELGGVAIAAMDAHRVQCDLHGGLGGEQLRHTGFHVGALSGVEPPRGEQGQLTGGGELGDHLGQVVAVRLLLPKRKPETLPLLGIPQGIFECCAPDSEGATCHLQPADLEAAHQLGEAGALGIAEQTGQGQAHLLEGDLATLHALVAQFGQVAREGEPRALLHQQDRDTLVPGTGRRVGLAEQGDQARPAGVGDPGLGAVDDVLAAVPQGGGADRLQVGATAGLRQRHGGS